MLLGLSLNTLLIEKSIDLSIFFLSQLYTNIKYGSKGIAVTGYINKNWKHVNYKQYHTCTHIDHSSSIQLISGDQHDPS